MKFVELSNHNIDEAFSSPVQLVFITVAWGMDRDKEKEKAIKRWKATH